MEDICSKDYAGFLEETLKALVKVPVEGLCLMGKMKGGDTFVSFHKISMADKLLFAGLLQQDATLEMLRANKLIGDEE